MFGQPIEIVLIAIVAGAVSTIPLFALYWLIRLAVRHGMIDAHARTTGTRR